MAPRKSHPHHVDPVNSQMNFVKATFVNKGEGDKYYEHLYGPFTIGPPNAPTPGPKSSHFGHSIGQRAGKLRLSGKTNAHRIGSRKK